MSGSHNQHQKPDTFAVTPEEEELWKEMEQKNLVQEGNRASLEAWSAAGLFVAQNPEQLGKISLREAFEIGFAMGYKRKGEIDGGAK